MLNAVICAVTVVPILAPIMTPIAWASVMRPDVTKPMTMTSVAEELCTKIVTAIPARIDVTLLVVALPRMTFRLSPQAFLSPLDMIVMPYRNSPTPPSRIKTS